MIDAMNAVNGLMLEGECACEHEQQYIIEERGIVKMCCLEYFICCCVIMEF